MQCLTNLIGLTTNSYSCWESEKPVGYDTANVSKSGMYLDTIEYTPDLASRSDVFDLLVQSRDEAITDLQTRYLLALSKWSSDTLDGFSDVIGRHEKTTSAMSGLSSDYCYMIITPAARYKGLSMKIKRVGLKIDTTGTYTIDLLHIDDLTTVIDTIDVSAVANKTSWINVDWEALEFESEYARQCYVLRYDRNGAKPHNVEIKCGCNDDPKWYTHKMLYAGGYNTDGVVSRDTNRSTYTYGLAVQFSLQCDPLAWMCTMDDTYWSKNDLGRTIAKAIQVIANAKLISRILNINQVNQYQLVNKEVLYGKRNHLNKLAGELIDAIALDHIQNKMIMAKNDCIVCKPSHGMALNEIIV